MNYGNWYLSRIFYNYDKYNAYIGELNQYYYAEAWQSVHHGKPKAYIFGSSQSHAQHKDSYLVIHSYYEIPYISQPNEKASLPTQTCVQTIKRKINNQFHIVRYWKKYIYIFMSNITQFDVYAHGEIEYSHQWFEILAAWCNLNWGKKIHAKNRPSIKTRQT